MANRFPISSCRRPWRALLLLLALVGLEQAAPAVVVDDFEDGIWNLGGHWGLFIARDGLNPDTIGFDETSTSGMLTCRYTNSGVGSQTTMILRDDVTLSVGQWVQMDVAIVPPNGNCRVGLSLAASRVSGPANTLFWGVRQDKVVRGHNYGAGGTELGDAQADVPYFRPGLWFTIAIHRATAAEYDLYYACMGQALNFVKTLTYTGSSGAGETPPVIPGLLLDNGQASFTALIDNFEVGSAWPPPIHPAKPIPPGSPNRVQLNPSDSDAIRNLPHLPSVTRSTVQMPSGNGDNTYHHGSIIEYWKGKLYCAWQSTPQGECSLPFEARVSSSIDGTSWSGVIKPQVAGDAAYADYMKQKMGVDPNESVMVSCVPRAFVVTTNKLYLFCLGRVNGPSGQDWTGRIFWTSDGVIWNEFSPWYLDELEADYGLGIRENGSNTGFIPLRDGRLMAAAMEDSRGNERQVAPITSDPTGLTGWEGGWIDVSDISDLGEPGGWEGPDGVLHWTGRQSEHIWHSFSLDQGSTWDKAYEQENFPDNPGNKHFGQFPNGWCWVVCNPVPGSRIPLMLGISKDGWNFNQNYLVRWEDIDVIWPDDCKKESGWEYPSAVYHDGYLYVCYSRKRDFIEVAKVDLRSIVPQTVPAPSRSAVSTPIKATNPTRLPSGVFRFSFTNAPGSNSNYTRFSVVGTTNVSTPFANWQEMGSVVELSPGQYQFTDAQATNGPQRFYRVRSP